MSIKQNAVSTKWGIVVLCVAAALGAGFVAWSLWPEKKSVSNFEECIAAGGARMESYPEQCLYESKTYINENQVAPAGMPGDDYIGMAEEEALVKAGQSNTPARVIERDGESLPATMDFVFGRHNLYIKEGKVYKVDVEGYASDAPIMTE